VVRRLEQALRTSRIDDDAYTPLTRPRDSYLDRWWRDVAPMQSSIQGRDCPDQEVKPKQCQDMLAVNAKI